MKKLAFCMCLLLLLLPIAGCSGQGSSVASFGATSSLPAASVPPTVEITQKEAKSKALLYYPDGVALTFEKMGDIEGNNCYIFEVYNGDLLVARVGVQADGQTAWFYDMYSGEEEYWVNESLFDFADNSEEEPPVPDPYFEYQPGPGAEDGFLYFANVQDIPELLERNEGSVIWTEETQTLQVNVTKATGTMTGAVDGPRLKLTAIWAEGKPTLENVEFEPAPMYLNPRLVLLSNEVMEIDDARLLEIATYFYDFLKEYKSNY